MLASDAMYTTGGGADIVHPYDSCIYVIASGDRQDCTVTSANGDIAVVPRRHARALEKGDIISNKSNKPVLVMKVHGSGVCPSAISRTSVRSRGCKVPAVVPP